MVRFSVIGPRTNDIEWLSAGFRVGAKRAKAFNDTRIGFAGGQALRSPADRVPEGPWHLSADPGYLDSRPYRPAPSGCLRFRQRQLDPQGREDGCEGTLRPDDDFGGFHHMAPDRIRQQSVKDKNDQGHGHENHAEDQHLQGR